MTLNRFPLHILFPIALTTLLAGCSYSTTASGTVVDENGASLEGATVTLAQSSQLSNSTKSDAQGKFKISLIERCLFLCAGGNPSLTARLDNHLQQSEYIERFKNNTHEFRLLPRAKWVSYPERSAAKSMSDLPEDFVPSAVYSLDAETCRKHQGAMVVDGNDVTYCEMGTAAAVLACESTSGQEFVTLVERPQPQTLIIRGSGSYEVLIEKKEGTDVILQGEHTSLRMKDKAAMLSTIDGETPCAMLTRDND